MSFVDFVKRVERCFATKNLKSFHLEGFIYVQSMEAWRNGEDNKEDKALNNYSSEFLV
jgi:hypothetical protein